MHWSLCASSNSYKATPEIALAPPTSTLKLASLAYKDDNEDDFNEDSLQSSDVNFIDVSGQQSSHLLSGS
jgi:hypothetical protein